MIGIYANESVASALSNTKALMAKQIELSYAHKRVDALQALMGRQKYDNPQDKISIDIQNSQGRYLPLQTQLNAELLGLDDIGSDVSKLNDQRAQIEQLEQFATQAKALLEVIPPLDGRALLEGLLKLEQPLSANIPPDDLIRRSVALRIHSELITTQMRFSSQMPVISSTVGKSSPLLLALAGGLFGGVLLAVVTTLFMRKYRSYQKQQANAPA